MKTLTEFDGFRLKSILEKKAELVAAGKTAEELPAALGEALKVEGDKLTVLLAALEIAEETKASLKRIVVYAAEEGKSAPSGTVQKGDKWFRSEFFFVPQAPQREGREGRGRDRDGKRGGRGGKRGGRDGGRDGKRGGGGRGRDGAAAGGAPGGGPGREAGAGGPGAGGPGGPGGARRDRRPRGDRRPPNAGDAAAKPSGPPNVKPNVKPNAVPAAAAKPETKAEAEPKSE